MRSTERLHIRWESPSASNSRWCRRVCALILICWEFIFRLGLRRTCLGTSYLSFGVFPFKRERERERERAPLAYGELHVEKLLCHIDVQLLRYGFIHHRWAPPFLFGVEISDVATFVRSVSTTLIAFFSSFNFFFPPLSFDSEYYTPVYGGKKEPVDERQRIGTWNSFGEKGGTKIVEIIFFHIFLGYIHFLYLLDQWRVCCKTKVDVTLFWGYSDDEKIFLYFLHCFFFILI